MKNLEIKDLNQWYKKLHGEVKSEFVKSNVNNGEFNWVIAVNHGLRHDDEVLSIIEDITDNYYRWNHIYYLFQDFPTAQEVRFALSLVE